MGSVITYRSGGFFVRALVLAGALLVSAPAYAALYAPGETLDPACAPLDANCGVSSSSGVGAGIAGQVPFYAANGSLLSATSSITILQDGRVGVGTATPTAQLQVGSLPSLSSNGVTMSTTANYPNYTNFTTSAVTTLYAGDYIVPLTSTAQARAVVTTGTGTTFSTFPRLFTAPFSGETYTVYRPSLNVDNGKLVVQGLTGNVGIGTYAPASLLHITGNRNAMIYQTQLDPMPDGSNYDVGGIVYTDHWLRDNITYYYSPSAYMKIVSVNTNGAFPTGVRGTQLEFGTANGNASNFAWRAATRMTVTADGNVGIGTTTPSYMLDVTARARSGDYLIGRATTSPSIVFVGDSLTAGQGGTVPYPNTITMPTLSGLTFTKTNLGVSGLPLSGMKDRSPDLNALYSNNAAMNIVVIWGGTNDMVYGSTPQQTYATLAQFAAHERSLGFRVLVATMISRGGQDANKNTYNAMIRANWPSFADGIVDLAANTSIGADGASNNTTYFSGDGIHLNNTGYALVGSLVQTEVETLVNGALNKVGYTGNVGVATTTPSRKLVVAGTVGFTNLATSTGNGSLCLTTAGDVVYNSGTDSCLSSTRETKHSINNLALSELSLLEKLNPVSFVYNGDAEERLRYGFIADEADAVDARLATRNAAGKLSGLDTSGFLALIVGAVQELSDTVSRFRESFTTNRLCVGTTCVTETEFRALLERANTAPAPYVPPAAPDAPEEPAPAEGEPEAPAAPPVPVEEAIQSEDLSIAP